MGPGSHFGAGESAQPDPRLLLGLADFRNPFSPSPHPDTSIHGMLAAAIIIIIVVAVVPSLTSNIAVLTGTMGIIIIIASAGSGSGGGGGGIIVISAAFAVVMHVSGIKCA